jgi:hypothetical protein
MLTWKTRVRGGAFLAATGVAAILLLASAEPSSAGLFSWLKGNPNQGGYQGGYQDDNSGNSGGGGFFGGRNGGGFFGGGSRAAQQPGSQAFHGDELPPEEFDAATAAWITNPALGRRPLLLRILLRPRLRSRATRQSWPRAAGPWFPPW